ncbi:P-II family nitrogen regulator [Pseudoclavibacter sp. RFBB5]|uniref:P-II family nitrogen regulator n=1 Tax=Pseudoclavibacter sp. RFBB5 TaxID=2080574 RepID=UPI000CE721F0|nr:P-II family nitrogen regulator [Pseudoclavibacter sp. RFBB5]PPG33082.1 transcriptional regulator [Pseudoclavibacter sp. RFBB5]
MKLVTAVIQPTKVDDVKDALEAAGFTGLTITAVEGHGHQKGLTEYYRGQAVKVSFRAKTRVEVLVADETLDKALEVVVEAARTGNVGDGKVWVTDVSHVMRVRTGESGPAAV